MGLDLEKLKLRAYAPYSGFRVASAIRVGARYFGGVNVENEDHRLSTHAEEGAIAAMVAALGMSARIDEIWVTADCCGKCRQQLAAFADKNVKVHVGAKTTTVGDFLPDVFTFEAMPAFARQAVTLLLGNGARVTGYNVEDPAFLSISAAQAAVAIARAEHGDARIVEAWSSAKLLPSYRQVLPPDIPVHEET